jgi:hypothetical protein
MAQRGEKMALARARTPEQEQIHLAIEEAAVEKDFELPRDLRGQPLQVEVGQRFLHRRPESFSIRICARIGKPARTFSIDPEHHEEYRELQTSSRTLKRVNATVNEGRPVYDFAIIERGPRPDDKLLIVTTDVSEAKFIDRVLPKEGTTVYRVDCYISWRQSDLRFYESVFEELSSKSLDLEGHQTEQMPDGLGTTTAVVQNMVAPGSFNV